MPCGSAHTSTPGTWFGTASRSNTWEALNACTTNVCESRVRRFRPGTRRRTLDRLPAVKLDHLYRMTDHTGIVEHAVFTVPNYPEGYSTDDNARALIVAILLEELEISSPAGALDLASRYLAFLWLAFDPTTKRFRNCLSYERQWQEPEGSEDSHGRALWGLGTVLGRTKDAGLRGAAGRLFELAVPAAVEFRSPRACAFALLGLHEYLESFPGDRAAAECRGCAGESACSTPTVPTVRMTGNGLKDVLHTPMLDCRKRSSERERAAETMRWFRPDSRRWIGWYSGSALRNEGPLRAHRVARLLLEENGKSPLRPATHRSVRGRFRLSASLPRNGKRPLAERSVDGIQLVPRR